MTDTSMSSESAHASTAHRDGNPTPLGEAIQYYGRIDKSLHILQLIDDDSYRRDIKWMRNLQEGRHALVRVQVPLCRDNLV